MTDTTATPITTSAHAVALRNRLNLHAKAADRWAVTLVTVTDGMLSLHTRGYVEVSTDVPSAGSGTGTLPVDTAALCKLRAGLTGLVAIELGAETLRIGAVTIPVRMAQDVPAGIFTESMPSESWDVPAAALARCLKAASLEDTRPILNSVHFEPDGTLVATDSYRLALEESPARPPVGFNVPRTAIAAILASKPLADVTVTVYGTHCGQGYYASTAWAELSAEDTTVRTRLVDGEFPPFRQLVPTNFIGTISLPAAGLLDFIKATKSIGDATTPLRVTANGKVDLAVIASGDAEAHTELAGRFDTASAKDEILIAFNRAYLAAAVEAAGTPTVLIHLIDALKPVVIEADEPTSHRTLLMPVRVA